MFVDDGVVDRGNVDRRYDHTVLQNRDMCTTLEDFVGCMDNSLFETITGRLAVGAANEINILDWHLQDLLVYK